MDKFRLRRVLAVSIILAFFVSIAILKDPIIEPSVETQKAPSASSILALEVLEKLEIKGRAPKTNYSRDQFGGDWGVVNGCDTRNIILNRDLTNVATNDKCQVVSGQLNDPYTGKIIQFKRGSSTSGDIQIDHVVALSDAWQKGAQQLSLARRTELANDPLELLAVDGSANQQKSDGDAATWLPPNKAFRCEYVARQIAVKYKYGLWVTRAEHDAMDNILEKCPSQILPTP